MRGRLRRDRKIEFFILDIFVSLFCFCQRVFARGLGGVVVFVLLVSFSFAVFYGRQLFAISNDYRNKLDRIIIIFLFDITVQLA
jgi:hypothetical protein